MKIFVSHATDFNFKDELYAPLRNSVLHQKHELILPHENEGEVSTKDMIRDCDLVVAEVTHHSFDQGLELGWANEAYVTIICFYKSGTDLPKTLHEISDSITEYDSADNMIAKITEVVDSL